MISLATPQDITTFKAVKVQVTEGDISRIPSDALITAINSEQAWFGGIDGVIMRAAGNHFHAQAAQANLVDGAAIVATGAGAKSTGSFNNVVFVVDDLQKKLRTIIKTGLDAANAAGFEHVTVPAIRMGVMLGVVEKSIDEAVREIAIGIKDFIDSTPNPTLKKVTFVIFRDQDTVRSLTEGIRKSLT